MGQFARYKLYTFRQPLAVYPLLMNTKRKGKVRRFWFSLPNKLYVRRIIWIKHVVLRGHIDKKTKKKLSQKRHISTRADVFTSSLHEAYLTHGHHTADSAELKQVCQQHETHW